MAIVNWLLRKKYQILCFTFFDTGMDEREEIEKKLI
jgi:hypothetical protein